MVDDWGSLSYALPDGRRAEWAHLLSTGVEVRWPDGKVERVALREDSRQRSVCDHGHSYTQYSAVPQIATIKDHVFTAVEIDKVEVKLSDFAPNPARARKGQESAWSRSNAERSR